MNIYHNLIEKDFKSSEISKLITKYKINISIQLIFTHKQQN